MRFTRLIIGFLVILLAVAVIAGEQMAGASADAVVNARLTTVRAPIAGQLTSERRALGSAVAEGESLGRIQDTTADDIRLNDLIHDRAMASAEVERLTKSIASIETAVRGLQLRSQTYREERVRQLATELSSAQSQIAVAEARVEEAQAAFARSQQLTNRGLEPSASFERIRATQQVAELELEDAKQRARAAEIVLQSARRGTFLGDGYNDAPYSEQQISELSLRLGELRASLAAEQARSSALQQRIATERLRVNRLASAELNSNVSGRVWEVLAGNGETVQRGQDLIRLIDCRSAIVTLSVSENVYNRLKVGDAATFRASADGQLFSGTITRLAGSGAETIYRNLAIAPGESHLERYDVTLLSPSLNGDPDLGCAVGRTGRAFFESRPFDFLRRFWS
ncbi:MAG TPA: HlyD family efflux transporter periplasmic adaptor subunit [Tianweitania sediminis]|nr:HlyD family efflux transporter periplasmic adaptor subunit [Tianweitania sediminis]